MDDPRTATVWAAINASARAEGAEPCIRHVVMACADILSAAGAGLAVVRDGGQREPLFATDGRTGEVEDIQITFGEGPCVDAGTLGRTILVPDITERWCLRRWPAFAPVAAAHGVRSIAAFPVRAGAARLGVLGIYRERPGTLDEEELAQALHFADAALVLFVRHENGISTDLECLIESASAGRRAQVHQATGMVAAQLGVSVADALAALRARTYSSGRRLDELAMEVVAGRIRFSES